MRYTQVIMLTSADASRGWRQMHGQNAPVQGQARPSWYDDADEWILNSTVVWFSGGVDRIEDFFGNHAVFQNLHDALHEGKLLLCVLSLAPVPIRQDYQIGNEKVGHNQRQWLGVWIVH